MVASRPARAPSRADRRSAGPVHQEDVFPGPQSAVRDGGGNPDTTPSSSALPSRSAASCRLARGTTRSPPPSERGSQWLKYTKSGRSCSLVHTSGSVPRLARTGSSIGLPSPDLRVARHAGVGRRNSREGRRLDRSVTVPAIHSQAADVVLVRERHRLIADDAHARLKRRSQEADNSGSAIRMGPTATAKRVSRESVLALGWKTWGIRALRLRGCGSRQASVTRLVRVTASKIRSVSPETWTDDEAPSVVHVPSSRLQARCRRGMADERVSSSVDLRGYTAAVVLRMHLAQETVFVASGRLE